MGSNAVISGRRWRPRKNMNDSRSTSVSSSIERKLREVVPRLPSSHLSCITDGDTADSELLRFPAANYVERPGTLLSLRTVSYLTKRELNDALSAVGRYRFRWW